MPVLGFGLHIFVAILCAVHVLRTGQERWWLFVLFLFPLLGSIIYVLAVFLPEMSRSRGGRRVVRGLRDSLDPGRELREAEAEFEQLATIANRIRVADALHGVGRNEDAISAYREALHGVHSDDPDIQVKLARALLDQGEATAARELLESLISSRPDFKSPDGHLIYARALAACGERDKAREEFDALIGYYAGIEARVRYIEVLESWDENKAAVDLVAESLHHVKLMPAGSRRLNAEWIHELKRASARLAAANS
ncbi:MAG TPA: tetratricopeptide repeat protein [Dokdonella sp.]|uniref:tetratricopeptide repeat protein n=1 Tax=Dokdonella sp. TaxID=2291710 RepID=UPI002D7F9353|nr:tetratricopeptide repeat protein [Dokdonella sp.]HET9032689.1 tetratricopeptide repeat protein [Dokdonella sp.]